MTSLAVLYGGDGADTFHVAASLAMPEIKILDFNAAEGDKIEISPSHALYEGFSGYEIVDEGLSISFISPWYGLNSVFVEVAGNTASLTKDSIVIDDSTGDFGVYELIGDYWFLGGEVTNTNKVVYGSMSNDRISGGKNDQFFYTLSGHDHVSGGGGIDTLVLPGLAKITLFL